MKQSSSVTHKRYPGINDVDALKKLAAEKRQEGEKILEKITQFKGASKERKKDTQTKKHKFQWLEESISLNDERKTLEQEIERSLWMIVAEEPEGDEGAFCEVVKEHSARSLQRQATMGDIFGDIQELKDFMHSNPTEPKFMQEFQHRAHSLKKMLQERFAELEQEEATLESEIAEMRTKMLPSQDPLSRSNSQYSTPRDSPLHTPSGTPRPTDSPDALSTRPSSAQSTLTSRSIPLSDMSSMFSDSSQLTDSSLIFRLDQMACSDVQLVETLHDEWNRMEQRFRSQLTSLRETFLAQNRVTDIKVGSWDSKSHFHFMSLYKQYIQKGKREELIERIIVEMPFKSRLDIIDHLQFVRNQHLYRLHQKAIKGMWRRERLLWFENAQELTQEANILADQKIKKELEASELQQKREFLERKLALWREDKAKKFASKMEELEREEQKAREKERVLNERLARARSTKKQLLSEYKQTKAEIENMQRMDEDRNQQYLDELKREQDMVNKERVEYRASEMEVKKQLQIQKKIEEQKIEQMKELQLEKLREKVRINAESDTERSQQGTVSSTKQARNLPPLFKSNYGYNDDKIVNDTRFKIERALDKAGLLHTKYAQDVLAGVPTKVRIDQLDSSQKDVYLKKQPV